MELELIEIEMLESEIRRLKLQNQAQSEGKERLRSTVISLEAANDDLISRNQRLVEENERLRSTLTELEKANKNLQQEVKQSRRSVESLENRLSELTVKNTELKSDLDRAVAEADEAAEEAERLFADMQEAERKYEEEQGEHRKVRREKETAEKENEGYERRIDRIIEENTEVILTVLTTQSDLEMELEKEEELLKSFYQKILMMVRETVRMMEERHVDGDDFEVSVPEGTHSAVEVMLQSLAVELAGVKRAYMRVAPRNDSCSDRPPRNASWSDWPPRNDGWSGLPKEAPPRNGGWSDWGSDF